MSNSYRIRTQVGVDKSVKILLDQDFEQLEILSLKILSDQIYNRQCSDYGVIVGRISINNGFGLPNCKVSIFIPLSEQDENNPIISTLYPYKSLTSVNEDGYRYNLLPYTKSYSAHVPTGSFPDREDALVDNNVIEVYDKYYKFTTQTNDSGDYMLFGVPLGSQTIHVDIDLSDIGEFSLSPQDLIRMGVATESQVAGVSFKSSNNLNSLPQIVSFNRTINVDPFWGQPEVCSIGITRTDFDVSGEVNIEITPTAIFMGSIFSSSDEQFQKSNCKSKIKQGELCNLVAGAGEILALRQTISLDSQGLPILEQYDLESGGQVIDENGTWLVDVPMNLDYVFTNEFGDRVLSNDPTIGIPTKGKYRFKIKWNQSPKLSEPIKRAYFLVPNIREYGWDSSGNSDPFQVPNPDPNVFKSYAFSLDWNDYVDPQVAIDCEDYFYLMSYNKVYSVSQLIDQYRSGYLQNRIISIKNILDETCESDNVKFPTNDAAYRFDLIYLLFIILLYIARPILYLLLIVSHLLAGVMAALFIPYWRRIANLRLPNLSYPDCDLCNCKEGGEATGPTPSEFQVAVDTELLTNGYLTPLWSFSQYTKPGFTWENDGYAPDDIIVNINDPALGYNAAASKYLTFSEQLLVTGQPYNPGLPSPNTFAPQMQDIGNGKKIFTTSIPIFERLNLFNLKSAYFDGRIPKLWNDNGDRWYPDDNATNVRDSYNPWGGGNRIRVSFRPTLNGYPRTTLPINDWYNTGIYQPYHFDNVMLLMVRPEKLSEFTAGALVTFQSSELSTDPNITGSTTNQFGNNATIGITINQGNQSINVDWAKFDGSGNNTTTYQIDQGVDDAQYSKYPMDIEYFQVITGMTIGDIYGYNIADLQQDDCCYPNSGDPGTVNAPGSLRHALFTRINIVTVKTDNTFVPNNNSAEVGTYRISPALSFNNFAEQGLVFLVRGVDPYSTRGEVEYDLSGIINGSVINNRILGNLPDPLINPGGIDSDNRWIIRGNNYKLNIPINGSINNTRHVGNVDGFDPATNQYLYYPSYHYQPTIGGQNGFISFNSKLPNYYSLLDKSTPGQYLANSRAMWESSNNSSTAPIIPIINPPFLKLMRDYSARNYTADGLPPTNTRRLFNAFQVEFRDITNPPNEFNQRAILNGDQKINIGQSWRSPNIFYRSYWPNQVVEGGTYMNQVLCLNGDGACTLGPSLDPDDNKPKGVSYYYAPSYLLYNSPYDYSNMVSAGRIVMRSDRLPTSTSYIQDLENTFPLFSNPKFTVYFVNDDETSGVGIFGTSSATELGTPTFSNSLDTLDDQPSGITILSTFTCSGLVPLGCYEGSTGEINVKPQTDTCYYNGINETPIMENGCYVLITVPVLTLPRDIQLLNQWTNRLQITFAACRNVWSHMFTNNWINGTLYAFAFKNDRRFDINNQPKSVYCKDTIILHPTNNFYYRSSPYFSGNIGLPPRFVGAPPRNSLYKGNKKNLKFPTTIIDLGPKTNYTQELVFSNEFDGYVMDRLSETTYKDVSEILNLLIISRLVNLKFIEALAGTGGVGVGSYFDSRNDYLGFVDGDYAQMISISSELGVVEFESSNYPPINPGQDPIYFNDTNSNNAIFGIFFSSDSQTRDFISPKRNIINELVDPSNNCAFDNFYVYSQEVPFYQWEINTNQYPNIFGSQSNTWYTDTINNGSFFYKKYQSLDRLDVSSRYFRTNTSTYSRDDKGYIYSYDSTTNEYNPDINSWEQNSPQDNKIIVGSPFYFYFGLKKGKTAWDRFIKKWINFENITE
jgi:hypothetical protein